MLAGLSAWHAGYAQVVLVGPRDHEQSAALRDELARHYLPFAIVVPVDPARQAALAPRLPFVRAMTLREGRPAAYVCRDFTCRNPVTAPDALAAELR